MLVNVSKCCLFDTKEHLEKKQNVFYITYMANTMSKETENLKDLHCSTILQIIGSKQIVLMWTELMWLTAEVSIRLKISGGVM